MYIVLSQWDGKSYIINCWTRGDGFFCVTTARHCSRPGSRKQATRATPISLLLSLARLPVVSTGEWRTSIRQRVVYTHRRRCNLNHYQTPLSAVGVLLSTACCTRLDGVDTLLLRSYPPRLTSQSDSDNVSHSDDSKRPSFTYKR